MRKLALLAVTLLATVGVAQSPLITLSGGTNQGNVGGGIYFDLTVNTTITINRIDFLCGANTVAGTGTMDVYLGPTTYVGNVTNPALWTLVASAAVPVAPSAISVGTLNAPFALAPGNYGVALKSNAYSNGYTNGVTCTSTTVPGSCANSIFSNAELTLRAGAAQNSFLAGGIFQPRIFNGQIHYTPGGTPIAVASWQGYGKGCYGYYRSFYQLFPNPVALNLGTTGGVANAVTAFKLVSAGNFYNVVQTNTPIVTPTSTPIALTSSDTTFNATASFPSGVLPFPILVPRDGGVFVASDLSISTDGYIVPFDPANPNGPAVPANDNTPTVNEFLGVVTRWAPHWKNMEPTSATTPGSMHVELDAASGALLVTWNNVADVALTTTSTFQVAFFANGDVEYRYGAMSGNGGGSYPVIIGFTNGNNSLDWGARELSGALPFSTNPQDNLPITLSLSARPQLGTSPNLTTENIPAGTVVGSSILSFTQINPGFDLASFGMPGCFQYTGLDVTNVFFVTGPTATAPFPIPNLSTFNGVLVYGQTLTLTPGFNLLGGLTSNGLRFAIGSL